MKQPSLFEDASGALPTVGVPGSQRALSKAQKRFNVLIARIEAHKKLLSEWRDFLPAYDQRRAAELAPLAARLRERQIAMAALLDRAFADKALGKAQAKVRHLLLDLLSGLLAEQHDADLVGLYDKHSERRFHEEQDDFREFARQMAGDMFGVEGKALAEAASAYELARLVAEKLEADEAAESECRKNAGAKKENPKTAAREALREQAAQGASRALREVYRRLVGALHPDRERDADEGAKKTALMQQVNRAYEAGDLLALLELQLKIEQIDPGALANLAEERVAHYNLVLEEQLQRLQEEIDEATAPFMGEGRCGRQSPLTPASVHESLGDAVHELETVVLDLEHDLAEFDDIDKLKRSLRDYQIPPANDEELALLGEMTAFRASVRQTKRRR